MTFQATVGPTCTVDELNMSVQAIGDCLTGGQNNGNCCEDPIFEVFDGSVSIIENENDTVYLSSCESIEWNGQVAKTGIYTYNGISVDGCDSIIVLDFTLNENYNYEENIVACDSYDWNGQVLNEGGIFTFEGQTASGCDSIVTLNLTIENTS